MVTRKRKIEVEEPIETCKSCRAGWFVETKNDSVWFCRLNPPTVTYDLAEQTQCSTFPVTAPDQWCGQFSAKLNS